MNSYERSLRLIVDAPMYVRDDLTREQVEDFAEQIRAAMDDHVERSILQIYHEMVNQRAKVSS